MFVQAGLQPGAHRTVGEVVGLLQVVEQEWEVEHHELLVDAGEQARGHGREIERAAAHGRQVLRVTTQHGVGEQGHLDLAAALLCHKVGELLDADAQGVVFRQAEGELEVAFLDVLRQRRRHGGCEGNGAEGGQHCAAEG